jgi:hypothetical protein
MNASIRSEEIESTADVDVDSNLAAVTEVEAGIRDFVRNDIAYLRRQPVASPETAPLEPNTEATVNNVNSLIQRVAGTSLAEIEKLISELESLRDLLHAEGQRVQREISGYAQPGRDEIDPHDRRQRHAVEACRRRPAQQLISALIRSTAAASPLRGCGGFI